MISQATQFLRNDVILVALAVYAVLGLLTDALVRLLKRRALAWRRGTSRIADPGVMAAGPARAGARADPGRSTAAWCCTGWTSTSSPASSWPCSA